MSPWLKELSFQFKHLWNILSCQICVAFRWIKLAFNKTYPTCAIPHPLLNSYNLRLHITNVGSNYLSSTHKIRITFPLTVFHGVSWKLLDLICGGHTAWVAEGPPAWLLVYIYFIHLHLKPSQLFTQHGLKCYSEGLQLAPKRSRLAIF